MKELVTDDKLFNVANDLGFDWVVDEAKLNLFELLIKAGAGYSNSHTEEAFLKSFDLMKVDRTPNKAGRQFIMEIAYTHSCRKAPVFYLSEEWRQS